MNQMLATFLQLLCAVVVLVSVAVQGQQDFTTAEVPNPFRVGNFYPPRPEVEVCRPIRDYIDRNSARFTNELVTNTNPDIRFSTADSRIMSSRMQSRLNSLATSYRQETGRRMTVLRAWSQFPDPQISNNMSLHYEGRTVMIRLSNSNHYSMLLEMAVEVAFDWVYFAADNLVRLSVIPTSCDRNVDCVFMLDQSGSVGEDNHAIAIQFIQNVISFFTIGLNQTRVGFVAYSTYGHVEAFLDTYTTLPELQSAISQINYRGGWTATAIALNFTRIILNSSLPYGARPSSEGIPKIGILLTDGKSNRYPLDYAAPALKAAGVQVYTVGIANADTDELQFISSDPDDEHVFLLSSFRDAAGFVDFLSVTTCETPAIVDPGENTTTNVPEGGIDYFQTECSAFSDTVLVELTDINGTSFLYCSAIETNPGPLTENTVRNETLGLMRRTCIVPLPSGSNVVYIGIQGQAEQNAFTIIVWDQLFEPNEVSISVLETQTGVFHNIAQYFIRSAPVNDFEFSIIESNSRGIFSISASTGRLSVSSLNFDQQQFHDLTILAQNSNIECQRARIRINIQVISNCITFEGVTDSVSIAEDATIADTVTTITASGGTGRIQYSINGGNGEGRFTIDSSTGVISVAALLDYEKTMSYSLSIAAASTGEASVTGMATQRIDVTDVNEAPYFSRQCANTSRGCFYMIRENQLSGTLVDRIEAMDPDLSSVPNGMLSYRLDESMSILPFAVNAVGQIRTTDRLDREERDMYTLTLIVSDGCPGCSISIQTTVTVMVTDENDNPPVFVQGPTAAQVEENSANGFTVAQYIANDRDSGANAVITYSLTFGGNSVPFSLDPMTGVLTVSGSIDFEMTESYTVNITASNPGSAQSASVTTIIEVLNLNDNSPIFRANPYRVSIPEHSTTTTITVEATDADRDQAGDVRYSVIDGNFQNLFAIDSLTGLITIVGDIDRETVASFNLTVEARDLGTPQSRRGTSIVVITITDINDNAPEFLLDPYSTQVREDIGVPFNILRVVAFDLDEQGNPNSELVYSITGGNQAGMFAINASTGQIQVVQSLDFETTPSYTLDLEVVDRGNSTLSDVTNATITLININEDPPMLTGSQGVEISELASINSVVAVFDALDPDNNVVVFGISSGNDENKFDIRQNYSGQITLVRSLDYETTMDYLLEIVASDGSQNTTAMLNVTVLDENEFAPVFEGETAFSINEEQPDRATVGYVMATDADGDPMNNEVTYSFVQSSIYFTVGRRTGRIRTRGILDREMLAQVFVPPASQISLEVTARDSASPRRQTTTSITIILADINDNSPIFADSMYENSLLENLPAGQTVFQVSATDTDLGSNAQISYSFVLNEHTEDTSLFMIDSDTGVLSTTDTLDCERQTSYSFTITATDGGTPPRNSTVQGTLTILDENDNDPLFSMSVYNEVFAENHPTMQPLVQVVAVDLDKGSNGQVRYSIMNQFLFETIIENIGEDITLFSINETSGVLMHQTPFNYEQNRQVNVTVTAFDLGLPRRSSTATVTFDIQNIDEQRPEFLSSCDAFIIEEMPLHSVVTQCEAEDRDSIATPGQVALNYTIVGGNEGGLFEIEIDTAIIRNSLRIDSDTRNLYSLQIEARDLVNRFVRRQVDISVRDINDNPPVFERASYAYHFTDIQIRNYVQGIVTIRASDVDNGLNGTVRYSIQPGAINRVSDKETVVTITATDLGTPPLSAIVNLTVTFDTDCLLQEYEIDATSGAVQAYVLCRIEIQPESVNVNLESSSSVFFCSILHNSRMTYQWIHNGSLITPPTLIGQGRSQISYSLSNAQFEHAGEYACKATTRAGSLQTTSRSVSIRVPPTITVPPVDIAVEVGQTASFHCAAVGIPVPKVEWFLGTTKVSEGTTLTVEDVSVARGAGTYVCLVSSEAGRVSSLAKLIIFESNDVVELDIERINNPVRTDDGSTCHFIDTQDIENILNRLTSTTVMVTGVSGENICEESVCLPNPCQNGGTCQLNDDAAGGYECSCRDGYTGNDCSQDVDECLDTPCSNEATCVNSDGGFQCECATGTSGHLCQFNDLCQATNTCSGDTVCVSTLSAEGFLCRDPPSISSSVVISFTGTTDIGFLNDIIQGFIEILLATASKNRKRRQLSSDNTLATSCEPRFIQPDSTVQMYVLIWLCPDNITEPSAEDQAVLCNVLLQSGRVGTCKPPNGEEMTPPTLPPLTDTSVKIEVVLFDRRDEPLSAADSSKTLEETGAQEQLQQQTGLPVEINTAPPEPNQGGINPAAGTSVEVAIGVVVGVVLLVLVVVSTVLTVLFAKKKLAEHKDRQQAKRLHAIAMVEKGTTVQENLAFCDGGTARSHPMLAPMTSTSSIQHLIDDDRYETAADSAQ